MNIDWREYIEAKLKDPAIKSVEVTGWDRSGYGYGRGEMPTFKIEKFTVDDLVNKIIEDKNKKQ